MAKILENLCKTKCKSTSKTRVNFCAKFLTFTKNVHNSPFPLTFSNFCTNFFTTFLPLYLTNIFHYSTDPTITTTNNLIERI